MHISLSNAGKRYNREWIFRHFSYDFITGGRYAITGPNGSGKSTLLQVIGGSLTFNEGKIDCSLQQVPVPASQLFRHISIAAPYLELIEEFTAKEMMAFHSRFKTLTVTYQQALQLVGLEHAAEKQIRYFSSGMKQRLKLAQAFFSDSPVLLLDEPTANLDKDGIAVYHRLISEYSKGRLVIVSSNDPQEYDFCNKVISIEEYKEIMG